MTIYVHRSERTDTLLAGLATVLKDTPGDPFTPEIVAVPTPGIERFITQGLGLVLGASAGQDGICANIAFPSPGGLVEEVIAQAGGDSQQWRPQSAVWPLLTVIDEAVGEPGFEALTAHLADHDDRRFALASRLAGLFASYASQRPELIREWALGRDAVPADLTWQPGLWRRLRERIGAPSPAEQLTDVCAAIAADPASIDLPARLSVFGPTRLPIDHLQVLRAIGEHRDVHVWLADASPSLWDDLRPGGASLRREDSSANQAHNPLLRSLGRDARELTIRLAEQWPDMVDAYHRSPQQTDDLLGALQVQIRDNRPTSTVHLDPGDRSIEIHSCHGQPRQAEVVREVVLRLLQDDPDLQPRDILIMCPDLDAFAPLLSAAFSDAPGDLRLRIADRTPEQSNAVLAALSALLEMATGRLELSTVLDFAARPPVAAKFGFDDESLERLEQLTAQAGIRWGLDAQHRRDYHLPSDVGTWSWGLDRLLLGVAMSEDGLVQVGGVLPVDDVASGDVELVGNLALLVDRVRRLRQQMLGRHSAAQWLDLLNEALDELMTARGPDSWQPANARGAIASVTESTTDVQLSMADIRWLLAEVLAGRPTRSNFRSGDLTVCGLMPMRSVPHRVICLVGMDDGSFPRNPTARGEDMLARDPRIGERDARSEDRQTLLDAIMAATDNLVITYTGADDRTNEVSPPCVPLGEMLDALDSMTAGRAREQILTVHPLQPFDPRNFTDFGHGPFSHDHAALTAARHALGERHPAPSMRLGDLPPLPVTELSPQELGRFLTSPLAAYLRARIGISLRSGDDPPPERIPIDLDGLAKWQIGDRSLNLLNRGEPVDAVARAERARGDLPPGALGASELASIGRAASEVATRFARLRDGESRQVPVHFTLPNGIRIVGAVSDVYGDQIVRATYSRSKPRDYLRLWPEALALAVTHPDRPWRATLVAKDEDVTIGTPADPMAVLVALVDLYLAGMRSPLPLTAGTSQSYAKRRRSGADPRNALNAARFGYWQAKYGPERELPEVVALWGDADLEDLLAEPPRPQENWFDEQTRFGMLARRLWEPILEAQQ